MDKKKQPEAVTEFLHVEIPADLMAWLRERAARNARKLNAEVRLLLEQDRRAEDSAAK